MADGQIGVIVSMIVGAGISLVGQWFHARHQEKLRQQARWEDYSQALWQKRSDHLPDLQAKALSASQFAFRVASKGHPLEEAQVLEFREAIREVERLQATWLILASLKTNEVLHTLLTELRLVYQSLTEKQPGAAQHAVKAVTACLDLADAARAELGVSALDQASRDILTQKLEAGDKLPRFWG